MQTDTAFSLARGRQGFDAVKNQPYTLPNTSLVYRTTDQQSSRNVSADTIRLSREARHLASQHLEKDTRKTGEGDQADMPSSPTATPATINAGAKDISSADLTELIKLQKRDAEVRAHEQAHLSRAGQHAAGGASFSYTTGPDGVRYATAGEVSIDMTKEETPRETLDKMQQVKSAALAPTTPSAADRRIAAKATMIAAQARQELRMESTHKSTSDTTNSGNETDASYTTANKTSPNASQQPSLTQDNGSQSDSREFTIAARHMILRMYARQSQ